MLFLYLSIVLLLLVVRLCVEQAIHTALITGTSLVRARKRTATMASDKLNADHNESVGVNPEHENTLLGVIALASLFSNCVEAFGLIRTSQKWEKDEQLLITRLGIQQARLLIWGDALGISSPPRSVTNSAVPKHPSAAYPDLKEPTFFGARDPRLDQTEIRTTIEDALNAIVDRSSHLTREQMMEKFGLKPPKRFSADHQPALDTTRLEAFREKYELLKEVAESYAHINTSRSNSITMQTWVISDHARFDTFIRLTQEKVDSLVELMGVQDQVDRAMRMDIRGFGWHLMADRTKVAQDVSKLKLIAEACKDDYPQYLIATEQALGHINRENRENAAMYNPYARPAAAPAPTTPTHPPKSSHATNGTQNGSANLASPEKDKSDKRPGLLKLFRSFRGNKFKSHGRSHSISSSQEADRAPQRSASDAGPTTGDDDLPALKTVRSKSVGAELEVPADMDERINVPPTVQEDTIMPVRMKQVDSPIEAMDPIKSSISRHDQYHGIARTETRELRQDEQ